MIKRNYSGWIIAMLAAVIITAASTLIVSLYIGKDIIAKSALEGFVYNKTGVKLSIGKLEIGIFHPYIHAENIIISNPPGFPEGIMLSIPLLYVEYDPQAAIKRQVRIKYLDLNIKLFNMVRNQDGIVNIDSFGVAKLKKKSLDSPSSSAPTVIFDKIHLKGGRVVYADYRQAPPKVTETQVDIDDTYENTTDLYALGEAIARKAFSGGPLSGLDLGSLQSGVVAAVSSGTEAIRSATKQTVDAVKGVLQGPVKPQDK